MNSIAWPKVVGKQGYSQGTIFPAETLDTSAGHQYGDHVNVGHHISASVKIPAESTELESMNVLTTLKLRSR